MVKVPPLHHTTALELSLWTDADVPEASHARLNSGVDKVIIKSMRPRTHSLTVTETRRGTVSSV